MCDQETMTVEPSVKRGSIVESGMGARRKESGSQIPGPDGTTQRDRKHSAGEGRRQQAASGAPTTTADQRSHEQVQEAPPLGVQKATRGAAVRWTRKTARDGGAAFPQRPPRKLAPKPAQSHPRDEARCSIRKHRPARRPNRLPRKSSSTEGPGVSALLIRRPSTSSKSSQRSSRATRYVGETPKVEPTLDVFSREHSSMAESPPCKSVESPAPAVAAKDPLQSPETPPLSFSRSDISEKIRTEPTAHGGH
ncbi:hypothetical protein MRX96_047933 [Rhipicephalus microplus]